MLRYTRRFSVKPWCSRTKIVTPSIQYKIRERQLWTTAFTLKKSEFRDLDNPSNDQKEYTPIFELNNENFSSLLEVDYPFLIFVTVLDGPPQLQELDTKLSKCIGENHGFVAMARLDARKHQDIAQELRVQQVPTLLALVDGKIVNSIVGVPTEQTLRRFVDEVIRFAFNEESQPLLDQAEKLLEANNIPEAAKLYSQLLSTKKYKQEPMALAGLANCALKEGNPTVAKELVDQIRTNYEDSVNIPKIKQVLSMVDLQTTPQSNVNIEEILQKLKQNPNDLESRYDLALHYQSQKKYQETVNELFTIIKTNKEWNNQTAKHTLLKVHLN